MNALSLAVLVIGLLAASCNRSHDCTAAELTGVYVVKKANPVWAKNSEYTQQDLDSASVELRVDGSAQLTKFPLRGKVTGIAKWSILRPGVIDLLVVDRNTVVPVGFACNGREVTLTYSDDPELPTNIVFMKQPNHTAEPASPSRGGSS